jgi:hypothetical protein
MEVVKGWGRERGRGWDNGRQMDFGKWLSDSSYALGLNLLPPPLSLPPPLKT